ncbi:DUF418 domain-containing protein [Microbulbifer sp.]|uniref:DUF418 domain-containing protein n=1 Tax=Microbulbifer sp. TaxID=1908541 RepID=UPI003F3526A7
MILLGIGYLHSLIYLGDILQVLAILGCSLVLLNRFNNGFLLFLSLFLLLQPHLICYIAASLMNLPGANDAPVHWGLYGKAFEVFASGTFREVVLFNSWQGQMTTWAYVIESPRLSSFVCLFIWGLLLGRVGFFARPEHFAGQRRQGLLLSLGACVMLYVAKSYWSSLPADFLQEQGYAKHYAGMMLDAWFAIGVMSFGVLLYVELYQFRPFARLAGLLAPCGRMSLTIYVVQGLLCVPLFYGFGLSWYQSIGQEWALVFGLMAYTALMLFASCWLYFFRYGPLEWFWRCATNGTFRVPFRRTGANFRQGAVAGAGL